MTENEKLIAQAREAYDAAESMGGMASLGAYSVVSTLVRPLCDALEAETERNRRLAEALEFGGLMLSAYEEGEPNDFLSAASVFGARLDALAKLESEGGDGGR